MVCDGIRAYIWCRNNYNMCHDMKDIDKDSGAVYSVSIKMCYIGNWNFTYKESLCILACSLPTPSPDHSPDYWPRVRQTKWTLTLELISYNVCNSTNTIWGITYFWMLMVRCTPKVSCGIDLTLFTLVIKHYFLVKILTTVKPVPKASPWPLCILEKYLYRHRPPEMGVTPSPNIWLVFIHCCTF